MEDMKKVIHPDDLNDFLKGYRLRIKGKAEAAPYTFRAVRRDGESIWFEAISSRIRYLGKPALMGFFRDITERKESEQALIESEQKYRSLVEQSLQGTIIARGFPPRFLFANNAIAEMLGYTTGELLTLDPEKMPDLIHPDDREYFMTRYRSRLENREKPSLLNFRAVRKDGKIVWLQTISANIDFLGKPALLASFLDISERKLAAAELRESRQLLEKMYTSLTDAIFVVDEETGLIVECNPAASAIFGYSTSEMTGNPPDMLHVDDRSAGEFEKKLGKELSEGGYMFLAEYQMKRKNGDIFPSEHTAVGLDDDSGRRIAHVFTVRDITERRRLEDDLRHNQKMQAVGTLAGGIAHDFNNLLTGILGLSSHLKTTSDASPEIFEIADAIESAASQAAKLTEQLLGFARKGKLQNIPVDIHHVVRDVSLILGRSVDKRIRIIPRLRAELHHVPGDPGQIQQVVMNLAVNACEAMPQGGELVIETSVVDPGEHNVCLPAEGEGQRCLLLSMKDTGCGIPTDLQERIFDPYFTTKERGKGTGLGLAMVYGIVQNHGGTIQVSSRPGTGSVFKVFLPISKNVPSDPAEPKIGCTPKKGKGSVLVVDDEELVLRAVRVMLNSLGYEVTCVQSAEQALEYYQSHRDGIDLILLDLVMPGMDGSECYHRLKEIDPAVKVVITTGHPKEYGTEELLARGVLAYIKKPYKVDALGEVLSRTLLC
jgi:PAS domain S-box-containing protein